MGQTLAIDPKFSMCTSSERGSTLKTRMPFSVEHMKQPGGVKIEFSERCLSHGGIHYNAMLGAKESELQLDSMSCVSQWDHEVEPFGLPRGTPFLVMDQLIRSKLIRVESRSSALDYTYWNDE